MLLEYFQTLLGRSLQAPLLWQYPKCVEEKINRSELCGNLFLLSPVLTLAYKWLNASTSQAPD